MAFTAAEWNAPSALRSVLHCRGLCRPSAVESSNPRCSMIRAYRPRLSKDKAVAQRLQDLSLTRQTGGPVEYASTAAGGATEADEAAARLSGSFTDVSSASTPMRTLNGGGSSRSRTRDLNPKKTTSTPMSKGKRRASAVAASAASGTPPPSAADASATATSSTEVSSPSFLRHGSGRRRREDAFAVFDDGGHNDSDSSGGGWSCLSCSYRNVEAAKKCKICGTKHYQTGPGPPMAVVRAVKGERNGVGGACETVVRDAQTRRHSGCVPRELRSPRRAKQNMDTANVSSSGIPQQQEEKSGGVRVEYGEMGSGDGESDDGTHRKRHRNSTSGRAITASSARTVGVMLSLPADVVPAAADSSHSRRRGRGRGEGAVVAVAAAETRTATTPIICVGEAAERDGMCVAQRTASAGGAGYLGRGEPPSSSSSYSRKRGMMRARALNSTAAAVEAEAAMSPSAVEMTHCTEPTGRGCLSTKNCVETALPPVITLPHLTVPAEERDMRPPSPASPRKGQTKLVPCIVPPWAEDCGKQDGDLEVSGLRSAKGEGGSVTAGGPATSRIPPTAASMSHSSECSPSKCAEGGHAWPISVAPVATLNFSGRPLFEVSSVVVSSPGNRISSSSRPGVDTVVTATPSIVVCHAGGVSVWDLTDSEAVCTYLSPELASVAKEVFTGRFIAVAVVGGDPAVVTPSATRAPGGEGICIMAIGRQGTDPGSPIFRVWQQQEQQPEPLRQQGSSPPLLPLPPQDVGRLHKNHVGIGYDAAVGENRGLAAKPATPAVLTIIVKKKFSKFFPPVVPGHVTPCLCVCGYSPSPLVGANGGGGGGPHGRVVSEEGGSGVGTSGPTGEITAVMALGGKALRLVFGAGRSGSESFVAKALPTFVAADAVCTSLAPVPTNPFLVCASLPLANAVLMWDVLEMGLLFTLPLTTSSVCIPMTSTTSAAAASVEASALPPSYLTAAGNDGNGNAATAESSSSTGRRRRRRRRSSEAGPVVSVAAAAAAAQLDARLLCLLATGSRDDSGDRSEPRGTNKIGCGLFGVFCGGGDGGAGTHTCGRVSAIHLEADAEAEGVEPSVLGGGQSERSRRGSEHDYHADGSRGLRCLCDGGNGFVVGVDRDGRVVARSVLTGEPRLLLTPDNATATTATSTFAALGCDGDMVALATARGVGGVAAATSVDLYTYEFCGCY